MRIEVVPILMQMVVLGATRIMNRHEFVRLRLRLVLCALLLLVMLVLNATLDCITFSTRAAQAFWL